jgi:hypothetical protein
MNCDYPGFRRAARQRRAPPASIPGYFLGVPTVRRQGQIRKNSGQKGSRWSLAVGKKKAAPGLQVHDGINRQGGNPEMLRYVPAPARNRGGPEESGGHVAPE